MLKTKRSKTKRSKTKRRNRKHNYLGKARIKYYSIKKGGDGPYSKRGDDEAEAASKDNVAEEARKVAEEARKLRALRVFMANQASDYAARAGFELKNAERQAKKWRNFGTNEEEEAEWTAGAVKLLQDKGTTKEEMVKAWDDIAQNRRIEAAEAKEKAMAARAALLTMEEAVKVVTEARQQRAEATAARKAKEGDEAARWRSELNPNPFEVFLRAKAVALRNSKY